ncbi:hypothetical protein [Leifsonia sp. AG29]|uniref:hypothetical protein n=1 Tax=Leifsonia sp. AG29 TaxID=2598860 RepID=UPI00131E71C7|nr:hypothetical protein [Leifsonia sp. AG29]
MTVKLNKKALDNARKLLKAGDVVHDSRDDWSEHAPSAEEENRFIEKNGWDEYALWHLGVDDEANEETKKRYSFPFGDFKKLHRCGVISLEGRASQNDHDDIAKASKQLLADIDAGEDQATGS